MEANILINKNKYELKYIKTQPGKFVSETLIPGFIQSEKGKYPWSKKRTYQVEAYWKSDDYFERLTEKVVAKNDKFIVKEGKLYSRASLEIVFENNTIIERFDTDSELNDRLISLRANVFPQPDVKLSQFNTSDFEYKAQWY